MIDVLEEVAEGRALVEWSKVASEHNGNTLVVYVMRDAMKFNGVPALEWDYELVKETDPWYTDDLFNGVRLPATAQQMQIIADMTGCLLMTPKVIDMIWLQAETKFDPITQTQSYPDEDISNDNGVIVATSHIHVVHQRIENAITNAGGDVGKLIASVGKYWCLINGLGTWEGRNRYGASNACNYGWPSSSGAYSGVTPGIKVWQSPGFQHDHHHWDPSQTIRLMYRKAILFLADGSRKVVDLRELAGDATYAPLFHHEGKLTYLRQTVVPEPATDIAMAQYAPTFDLVA